MTLKTRADTTAKRIFEILGASATGDQAEQVARAIEAAIIETTLDERKRCTGVVARQCPADTNLAHKINAKILKANAALIANLSGMR